MAGTCYRIRVRGRLAGLLGDGSNHVGGRMGRVTEYCPHCDRAVRALWKGRGLYCSGKDHYIRARGSKRQQGDPTAELRQEINDTFNGVGQYSWTELKVWARRRKYTELEELCADLEQLALEN